MPGESIFNLEKSAPHGPSGEHVRCASWSLSKHSSDRNLRPFGHATGGGVRQGPFSKSECFELITIGGRFNGILGVLNGLEVL